MFMKKSNLIIKLFFKYNSFGYTKCNTKCNTKCTNSFLLLILSSLKKRREDKNNEGIIPQKKSEDNEVFLPSSKTNNKVKEIREIIPHHLIM